MNKKGSIFLGVSLAIFIFITGVLILPYLTDDVDTFREAMNCTDDSITAGNKISCLYGDAITPYYIWFFSSLALGLIIGGRK